ncbi:hypothetical protein [Brucella cytisi]|nr:hypothetical protein [Brucella cytisi]
MAKKAIKLELAEFDLFGHYVALGSASLTFLNDPSFCVGPKLRRNLGA